MTFHAYFYRKSIYYPLNWCKSAQFTVNVYRPYVFFLQNDDTTISLHWFQKGKSVIGLVKPSMPLLNYPACESIEMITLYGYHILQDNSHCLFGFKSE